MDAVFAGSFELVDEHWAEAPAAQRKESAVRVITSSRFIDMGLPGKVKF